MTLTDNILVVDMERCKPTAFPFDDAPSGPTYPPRKRKDVTLPPLRGKHRPGHHPGMRPLSAFGVEVERKPYVNRWVWITLAYVLAAVALAVTSAVMSQYLAEAEPSPTVVSVMEDSPAAFTAVLLDVHGGSGR